MVLGETVLYGPPTERGKWSNPNYQAFNADGSRNYDPNATSLSQRDRDYNKVLRATDPLGVGKLFGFKKRKAPPTNLWNQRDGGWNSVLNSMEGNATTQEAIHDLLNNFVGSNESFADFMEVAGPLFGTFEANRFEQSDAFQFMKDTRNWDQGAYAGYGAAAGGIGQATARSQRQAGASLASQGLGRSSGNSAIQAMLQQQGQIQQSQLRGQTEQQASMNRMNSAVQMQDAYRLMSQMVMGQGLLPRITSPQQTQQSGYGGVAGGAMAGAQLGSTVGPWGTLIGGLVGAGAGYAASK